MTKQNAFRRGFTLIELMIVIVILGILMGTILPRLTGAQSRARDTARIADLNNISQALEVYASDFGQYPNAVCDSATNPDGDICGGGTTDVAFCLDDAAMTDTSAYTKLKQYMKGNRVPQNVGIQTNTLGCKGSYFYKPLKSGGSSNQSYVLASDLETWQMANYQAGSTSAEPVATAFSSASEADGYINAIEKFTSEPAGHELNSIYIVIP